MPGFTAEVSLGKITNGYGPTTQFGPQDGRVLPQMFCFSGHCCDCFEVLGNSYCNCRKLLQAHERP